MVTQKTYKVIGLMSGTSLDGIDAALIETDGLDHVKILDFAYAPYAPDLRQDLQELLGQRAPSPKSAVAEQVLTKAHAELVKKIGPADLIGFHGQTLFHDPDAGFTWQLGDGALLAKLCGMPVVNDFRSADIKAGGQGAPLVPVYHRALAKDWEKPVALLNIGGVANITYVDQSGEMLAFDTGPGNALMDDLVRACSEDLFDRDGMIARRGKINQDLLDQLLHHSYFSKAPPKSLDRNAFSLPQDLSLADGLATLAAFTVQAVVKAQSLLPASPQQWIICGGGRKNSFLMQLLREKLEAPVRNIDDLGYDGDAIEAQAFAYLAVRSVKGLPLSFPGTTGVRQAISGGRLHNIE